MSNLDRSASPNKTFGRIGVVGGGAWGTALAQLCAENGVETCLWAREAAAADAINDHAENKIFLPNILLNPALRATTDMNAIAGCDAYIFTTPAQHARQILPQLRAVAANDAPVALCSKGIERETSLLQTEVLAQVWPTARPAVLSGPSFARDVATGLPTAVTLACTDQALGARWSASVGASHFRPYWSDDLIGAELGGAVKNVLAIAAGAVVGTELGESARAALIARGFSEFQRLGRAMGARAETMAGLSGLGDLILTAGAAQSRNMSLGVELGKGRALSDILASRNSVSEGVATAPAIKHLADKHGVAMPICDAVADLVSGRRALEDIVQDLLARPFRPENDPEGN